VLVVEFSGRPRPARTRSDLTGPAISAGHEESEVSLSVFRRVGVAVAVVVATLVGREVPVYSAVPRTPTLEDVYFAIEERFQ